MKPKTWTHPKFALLQRRLRICPALAAGILEGIWHLAATFDSDGGRLPYTDDELAAWLGVDLAADELLAALVDGRWIDDDQDGLRVHDWADHKPSYIRDTERKQRQRAGTRPDSQRLSRDCPVTVPGHTGTFQDIPSAAGPSDSDSVFKKERKSARASARFVPPTLEEVRTYSTEAGLGLDADRFVDFYASKDWLVGRAKMRDWKAAARNASREGWAKTGAAGNGDDYQKYRQDLERRTRKTMDYLKVPKE